MKKLIMIYVVLMIVLLKTLIPSNEVLLRQTLSFLGLEQSSVQTLGRSMIRTSP